MIAAVMEGSRMPFTAHDLRYNLQDNFPKLCAYLQQRAKHWLGTFAYASDEVDVVVEHCIEELSSAPRQLLAVIQELDGIGIEDLVQELKDEFRTQLADVELSHLSQHKDHAHKKLRHCLQHSSTNLAVLVALRLTEYRH